MSDGEMSLVKLVCEGDIESFWHLVAPCQTVMFSVAVAIVRNHADAQEVTQEAVLKALANIRGFRGDSKFRGWLIRITINEALQRLRKDRRDIHRSLDEFRDGHTDDSVSNSFTDRREAPTEALQREELRDALRRAFRSLSREYREVLTLRDVEELTTEEAGRALGLTKGNVKTRLRRARLQMRDALAPGFC